MLCEQGAGHQKNASNLALLKATQKIITMFKEEGVDPKNVLSEQSKQVLEDEALITRVREAGLTLPVSPLSNLSLCVVDDLKDHPMTRMLELGLNATINSDDPAYFGGYVNQNYVETAAAVGLTREDIITLARNSFTGSFLSAEAQAVHLADIDRIASAHN